MWIVACATCGEQFAPKRSDAVYCSAACKQKAYERRQKHPEGCKPKRHNRVGRPLVRYFEAASGSAWITVF
jgi:hypothetical protein